MALKRFSLQTASSVKLNIKIPVYHLKLEQDRNGELIIERVLERMREDIGKALLTLLNKYPYSKISIKMICDNVPTSRQTFYYYFSGKENLTEWLVEKDFMEHAFPLFSYHLGENGCQAFFTYIANNDQFYRRIIQYDEGEFLKKCLVNAYDKSTDLSSTFARPVINNQKHVNQNVYRQYANNGIASVVVYWITDGMKIEIKDIARDLYLMIEKPLSFVRDNYLL